MNQINVCHQQVKTNLSYDSLNQPYKKKCSLAGEGSWKSVRTKNSMKYIVRNFNGRRGSTMQRKKNVIGKKFSQVGWRVVEAGRKNNATRTAEEILKGDRGSTMQRGKIFLLYRITSGPLVCCIDVYPTYTYTLASIHGFSGYLVLQIWIFGQELKSSFFQYSTA